jgi:hypothetical protein
VDVAAMNESKRYMSCQEALLMAVAVVAVCVCLMVIALDVLAKVTR